MSPLRALTLDPAARARAMSLSLLEAVFYAVMVGAGEGYFLADAVRLGANALQLGLVVGLPLFVGGLGPVIALRFADRGGARKPLVVVSAGLQALCLAALALADAYAWLTPASLIALVCLHQVFGQACGTAWSAWFGGVVPAPSRGQYFARRSRRVQIATMLALLAAGAVLEGLEPGSAGKVARGVGGNGFVLAFGVAALARAVSCLLLALSPEPVTEPQVERMNFTTLLRAPGLTNARRVLAVGATLQLAVYLASPYFGPFMLGELHLSYSAYTVANLAVVGAKILSLSSWGRVVDGHNPRSVYLLAAFLVAIIPLPWLWAQGLGWVIVAQCLSGFAWGGHEIAQMALYLDITHAHARQHVFAAQSFLQGTTQLLGTLLGSHLLVRFEGQFWLLFLTSALARAAVALGAPRALAHVEVPTERRHVLLLRVMGLRPAGGLVHRPVTPPETPPPEPTEGKTP
ncbi:MAG: MFS transporter [Myxococcales bacterium]|nr:MFS transporter [Myxococcales bacterium]